LLSRDRDRQSRRLLSGSHPFVDGILGTGRLCCVLRWREISWTSLDQIVVGASHFEPQMVILSVMRWFDREQIRDFRCHADFAESQIQIVVVAKNESAGAA